jgi:hypothetical protein
MDTYFAAVRSAKSPMDVLVALIGLILTANPTWERTEEQVVKGRIEKIVVASGDKHKVNLNEKLLIPTPTSPDQRTSLSKILAAKNISIDFGEIANDRSKTLPVWAKYNPKMHSFDVGLRDPNFSKTSGSSVDSAF